MPKGRSKVTRVAMPSAKVSAVSATTRVWSRQERVNASARAACTPITLAWLRSAVRTMPQPLARLVEVAAELDQLGAIRAHRRVLLRVVAERHDDRAGNAFALTGERDRLAVIAGGRGDHTAPFVGAETRDQVDAAADLERPGRVVVLVFDGDVESGLE